MITEVQNSAQNGKSYKKLIEATITMPHNVVLQNSPTTALAPLIGLNCNSFKSCATPAAMENMSPDMSADIKEAVAVKASGQHAQKAAENLDGVTAKAEPATRVISLEECQQHTREEDCWLVIHGKVLDVTGFLDEHPGGFDILISSTGWSAFFDQLAAFLCVLEQPASPLLAHASPRACWLCQGESAQTHHLVLLSVSTRSWWNAGKDASEDFDEIGHSKAAQEMLDKWVIGDFEVS